MRIVKICTKGVQRLDWQIVTIVLVIYIQVHAKPHHLYNIEQSKDIAWHKEINLCTQLLLIKLKTFIRFGLIGALATIGAGGPRPPTRFGPPPNIWEIKIWWYFIDDSIETQKFKNYFVKFRRLHTWTPFYLLLRA